MDDEQRAAIIRCQNGDHTAFEMLIQANQRMIHALTFRMTGSQAEAEDLAQETFIQAFNCIQSFRGDSAFSSWLYRIAVNLCLNWQKREIRLNRLRQQWEPSDHEPGLNDVATQQVQQALMKLHPKQRAAVILTICDGWSHAEAAHVLGCSETTVSWRIFAAKKKLKRWLSAGKASDE